MPTLDKIQSFKVKSRLSSSETQQLLKEYIDYWRDRAAETDDVHTLEESLLVTAVLENLRSEMYGY